MPIKRLSIIYFYIFFSIVNLYPQVSNDFELVFEVNMAESEKLHLSNEISAFSKKMQTIFLIDKRSTTRIYFKPNLSSNRFNEWGVGFFLPQENAIYLNMSEYEDRRKFHMVLKHEIVHSWSHDFHSGRNIWPLWFEEGIAQFLSGKEIDYSAAGKLSTALLSNSILSQDSLLAISQNNNYKVELFYLQSLFIIQQIDKNENLDEYIHGKFWGPRGGSPYGFKDWVDFEIWWQTELENQYRWYLFFNFDISLAILFVILFLTVYIIKSLKNRRKLKEMTEIENVSNED